NESEKYRDTLQRGGGLVRRYLERSKGGIPVDQLVEFYDSHGLTPDDVGEVAEEMGVNVVVPDDFYSLVALRHMKEKAVEEDSVEAGLVEKVEGLDRTRTLFYEDPYMREFEAEVVEVIGDRHVVLDRTAFYAEGGGQISDTGFILKDGLRLAVNYVQSVEGVILHEMEDAGKLSVGDRVTGTIDWERRQALMRSHTATHLILGAARRVLGDHAWQAGAQKGVETSRLDVSHYRRLTRREVEAIERLANQVVREGRHVSCRWMQRDDAEAKYGFRLYQGGAVPGKEIRVVEVEGGWDVEACGGTHLANTSEAGLIRIVNTERVQDGVERLVYAVGPHALAEVQRREAILADTAELLGAPMEKVKESVANNLEAIRELRHQLEALRQEMAGRMAREFLDRAEAIGEVKVIIEPVGKGGDFLIDVGNALGETGEGVVAVMHSEVEPRLVVTANRAAQKFGVDAGELAKAVARVIGGGGGGKPHLGQGGGGDAEKFKASREDILGAVRAQLD
ncbi:MAG: alanine--tRNA ligase-related protein, partial [Candidatus Bathyarchaeota archaeon]|nr:alanine--tRNA ligase-related protein [Candidatus Bathyarchaeota archaeon]